MAECFEKYYLAKTRSVPKDGSDLRGKTSRASLWEEGEWVYWNIRVQTEKHKSLSNCAVVTTNCFRSDAGSETLKPGLSFQLSQIIPQSGTSPLHSIVPLSSSAHSCSNWIKTLLDPPMLKAPPAEKLFSQLEGTKKKGDGTDRTRAPASLT